MNIVLQVLGVIFLLIIVFVVVIVLTIRSKIRGFVKNLEGLSKTLALVPSRIKLRPLAAASWLNEESIAPIVEALQSLGFEKVGDYQIAEVERLNLQAWQIPSRSINAVIYERPPMGQWVDLYTHFEDETRFTYSNGTLGAGFEHAPGHDIKRFPGMDVRELFEKFVAERPDRPAKQISADSFADVFEKVYADEQDWRNSQGGASEAEIRAIGMSSGNAYDDDVIEATHTMVERHALEELDEAIRGRFLEETKMTASEWERVRDRVVMIHDRMNAEVFEEVVGPWVDDESLPGLDDISGETARRVFTTMNESLPKGRRFKRLGTVSSPLEADIYAVPDD